MRLVILLLIFICAATSVAQPVKTNPAFLNQGHYWADSVLNTMDINQKIGQLLMLRAPANNDPEMHANVQQMIREHHIGGVIFFGGHTDTLIQNLSIYQQLAKIPLATALDAEWGAGMRMENCIDYPYPMTLGAVEDTALLEKMGLAIGQELKSMGVDINFAPVVDLNNNPANPVINWRAYSDNPERVISLAGAYSRGLQNAYVMSVAKHFPGHGDTSVDSHYDLPVIPHSRERLNQVELVPFKSLIDDGVGGVMTAHLNMTSFDAALPSTLSGQIVKDMLVDSLGFQGLVFTDALDMKGVTNYFTQEEIGVMALKAGNDVLLVPEDGAAMISGIKSALAKGEITEQRIEQSVRKLLLAKYWFGLNRTSEPLQWKPEPARELVKRNLVKSSITLLQNQSEFLPLQRLDTLTVASLSINAGAISDFQNRLDDYMPIDHFQLDLKADIEERMGLLESLRGYNIVIVGLHQALNFPWSNDDKYPEEIYKTLAELSMDKKLVLVHFRNPYLLPALEGIDASALLTTYQDGPMYQDYAAQLIFGGIEAKGKLPITVNDKWQRGFGLNTGKPIRFEYTQPEAVGINSIVLEDSINSIMQAALDSMAFPGAQILLAKDQKVFYHKTFGYHTYDRTQQVRKDDIYDLASITKVTAATAGLMKLHDYGVFDLDARLKDYFPYFRWSNKRNLNFRDILTHNARLKPWIAYYQTTTRKSGKFRRKTLSRDSSESYNIRLAENLFLHQDYKKKIYKMIKKSPLNAQEGYTYSGLAFYIFPDLITRKTGVRYPNYLYNQYYTPLGAGTITFNPYQKFPLERIVPTEQDDYFRNRLLHGVVHDEGAAMMDGISGNAGLFSTANDLAKMWQMYMNMGEYGGRRYISHQTMQKFSICQYCETGNKRALGFDKPDLEYDSLQSSVAKGASLETFGHSGYTGTLVWADPDANLLFIFLSNRVYPTRDNRKLYTMNIRPRIHNVVYSLLGID